MDFFHCNSCFIQPGSHTSKSFFLTSCGHSFCEDCIDTGESVCRLCNNQCKLLDLKGEIPSHVKLFFRDGTKELKKVLKILSIQNNACKIYMEEYVPKLEKKYMATKLLVEKKSVEIKNLRGTIEEKNAEIVSLHKANKNLEAEMEDLKKRFSDLYQPNRNVPSFLPSPPNSYASSHYSQGMFTSKQSPGIGRQSRLYPPRDDSPLSQSRESIASQGMCTPRSVLSSSSLNSRMSTPSTIKTNISPNMFLEKKSPTAMELLFKNKESSYLRLNPMQNMLGTPRSNQTFKMSVNTSERCDDEMRPGPRRSGGSSHSSLLNKSASRMYVFQSLLKSG